MTDLSERFERLGLSQYLDTFVSEGFDTWNTVLDITESDLYVFLLHSQAGALTLPKKLLACEVGPSSGEF